MQKVRFVLVFMLLALLLSAGSGTVLAKKPSPVDVPKPSEPVITESSRLERVTIQTKDGEKQALVPVTFVESVQTAVVPQYSVEPGAIVPNAVVDGVVVTMWRGMGWYDNGGLWSVWTQARTFTSQCVDGVNVWAEHQYLDGGSWEGYWGTDSSYSSGGCHNDSGLAETGAGKYYPGTSHQSRGVHVAYINGHRYPWDQTGPGPLTVP